MTGATFILILPTYLPMLQLQVSSQSYINLRIHTYSFPIHILFDPNSIALLIEQQRILNRLKIPGLMYAALLVVIVLTILRYLDELDDGNSEDQAHITETEPLRSGTYGQCRYGTCEGEDEDEETGSCSSSSSEELYDGKICVICYDEERNCFFVPCGHCATCYNCAQRYIIEEVLICLRCIPTLQCHNITCQMSHNRIFAEDCKICPVCRRPIRKVRKWFNPQGQNVLSFLSLSLSCFLLIICGHYSGTYYDFL